MRRTTASPYPPYRAYAAVKHLLRATILARFAYAARNSLKCKFEFLFEAICACAMRKAAQKHVFWNAVFAIFKVVGKGRKKSMLHFINRTNPGWVFDAFSDCVSPASHDREFESKYRQQSLLIPQIQRLIKQYHIIYIHRISRRFLVNETYGFRTPKRINYQNIEFSIPARDCKPGKEEEESKEKELVEG